MNCLNSHLTKNLSIYYHYFMFELFGSKYTKSSVKFEIKYNELNKDYVRIDNSYFAIVHHLYKYHPKHIKNEHMYI